MSHCRPLLFWGSAQQMASLASGGRFFSLSYLGGLRTSQRSAATDVFCTVVLVDNTDVVDPEGSFFAATRGAPHDPDSFSPRHFMFLDLGPGARGAHV